MSVPASRAKTAPPPIEAQPAAESHGASVPALTPASTFFEPSAFMTTTDQLPLRTFQSTVCLPAPFADTVQNRCATGGAGGPPPGVRDVAWGDGGSASGSGAGAGPRRWGAAALFFAV